MPTPFERFGRSGRYELTTAGDIEGTNEDRKSAPRCRRENAP